MEIQVIMGDRVQRKRAVCKESDSGEVTLTTAYLRPPCHYQRGHSTCVCVCVVMAAVLGARRDSVGVLPNS